MFLASGAIQAEDKTLWVGPAFYPAPNVNQGIPRNPFSPQVVDLERYDWSHDTDGDIRLCFDNSPLIRLRRRDVDYQLVETLCTPTDLSVFGGKDEFRNKTHTGLIIRQSQDAENTTCHAEFPVRSLALAMKHFIRNGISETSFAELDFYPPGSYLFDDNSIVFFFGKEDKIGSAWTASGRNAIVYLSMNEAWQCLLPAFQLYWNDVLETCVNAANSGESDLSANYEFVPILKNNVSDMAALARSCFRKDF